MGTGRSSDVVGASELVLVGITHRQARVEVLERVHLDRDASAALGRALTGVHGVSEAVVLSTCNRTELYLHGPAPDGRAAVRALAAMAGVAPAESLDGFAFQLSGVAVARHLLRVTTGLESRITGEVEVFGQVRAAAAAAIAGGAAGPHLASLFRYAVAAGRKARRTSVAAPPSLPQLALAAGLPDGDRPSRTLVLGSGAVARATADELRRRELDYLVCARRPERAAQVARSPEGVVPYDELYSALEAVDLLVCATSARSALVAARDLAPVMLRRPARRLTILDLCLPRAVEPSARAIGGVRLVDLDGVVAGASASYIQSREDVVAAELQRYQLWLAGRSVAPTIVQLREHVHAAFDSVSGAHRWTSPSHADAPPPGRARRDANRLLHPSLLQIKQFVAAGDTEAALAVVASFGVGPRSATVGTPRHAPLDRRGRAAS